MFGLTHFGLKKHTFIVAYCQQIFVADSFKRPSFWIHASHKNSKLIIFFGLLRLHYHGITKVFWSSEGEIIKIYSIIMKKQQKREWNFWNTIFDYALWVIVFWPSKYSWYKFFFIPHICFGYNFLISKLSCFIFYNNFFFNWLRERKLWICVWSIYQVKFQTFFYDIENKFINYNTFHYTK